MEKTGVLELSSGPDLIPVSASGLESLGQVVPLLGRSAWASVPCVPKTRKQLQSF